MQGRVCVEDTPAEKPSLIRGHFLNCPYKLPLSVAQSPQVPALIRCEQNDLTALAVILSPANCRTKNLVLPQGIYALSRLLPNNRRTGQTP